MAAESRQRNKPSDLPPGVVATKQPGWACTCIAVTVRHAVRQANERARAAVVAPSAGWATMAPGTRLVASKQVADHCLVWAQGWDSAQNHSAFRRLAADC